MPALRSPGHPVGTALEGGVARAGEGGQGPFCRNVAEAVWRTNAQGRGLQHRSMEGSVARAPGVTGSAGGAAAGFGAEARGAGGLRVGGAKQSPPPPPPGPRGGRGGGGGGSGGLGGGGGVRGEGAPAGRQQGLDQRPVGPEASVWEEPGRAPPPPATDPWGSGMGGVCCQGPWEGRGGCVLRGLGAASTWWGSGRTPSLPCSVPLSGGAAGTGAERR